MTRRTSRGRAEEPVDRLVESFAREQQWLRLAEIRKAEHPADALAVYQGMAEEVLQTADRRAYATGVRILRKAASAAEAADRTDAFAEHVNRLRERYRRRPTLIAMLDKARLA